MSEEFSFYSYDLNKLDTHFLNTTQLWYLNQQIRKIVFSEYYYMRVCFLVLANHFS